MHYISVLSALVASVSLVAAAPAAAPGADQFVRPNTNLRSLVKNQEDDPPPDKFVRPNTNHLSLIKTSEDDQGTWVTDEEKITNYVAKYWFY